MSSRISVTVINKHKKIELKDLLSLLFKRVEESLASRTKPDLEELGVTLQCLHEIVSKTDDIELREILDDLDYVVGEAIVGGGAKGLDLMSLIEERILKFRS